MLCTLCSKESRSKISIFGFVFKMTLLCYFGKWLLETYDLVEVQMYEDSTGKTAFDPYALLHIENTGEFDTEHIHQEYDRLAAKYHPDVVLAKNKVQGSKKVPFDKAIKRWENLNKAMATLTTETLFWNYQTFGDPYGGRTIAALKASIPNWLFAPEFRSTLITWAFVCCIAIPLFLSQWVGASKKTGAGILDESRVSMKDFMLAILEDNPKSERIIGFSDGDMIEIYEQSMEVIALNEQMAAKKATFEKVVKWMMEKAKEHDHEEKSAGGGDACCGGGPAPKTPDGVIKEYLPRLTEILIQILGEAPFHGMGSIPLKDSAMKFKSELLLTTILNFTLRVLGTKLS